MNSRASLVTALALIISACGGGGSGSNPPSTGGPSPTPTPTPTPSPTPSPSANIAFKASMGAPLVAHVIFDTNGSGVFGDSIQGNQDIITASNRSGEFGRDATGRQSPNLPPATATFPGLVSGVSTLTGFLYADIHSPLEAAIFSPATSLLGTVNDDIVSTNLGLQITARELGNFDAFVALDSTDQGQLALARQVTALNLKLLAFAGLETTDSGAPTNAITVQAKLLNLREEVLTLPTPLNEAEATLRVLRRSNLAAFTSEDGLRAASRLLARYGEAVDQYLVSKEQIDDIEYGLRIRVLPILNSLFGNGAPTVTQIAQIDVIGVADITGIFAEFSTFEPIQAATADFVAVADWRTIDGFRQFVFSAGCANQSSLVCNDVNLNEAAVLNVQTIQVTAVRVPAQFSSYILASLESDGTVVISRLDSVDRLVWLEYDAMDSDGNSSSARVYIQTGEP